MKKNKRDHIYKAMIMILDKRFIEQWRVLSSL